MRVATIKIKGLTPYSQSKAIKSERPKQTPHDEFDEQIWREHIHADKDGNVFIPVGCITQGLSTSASYLGKTGQLSKKGQSTWAENIRCGLAVAAAPKIGKKIKDAVMEKVYCHADGKRTCGTRVWRRFPMFSDWSATMVIHILDDNIPEAIFEAVVEAFGLFNGIGRHRPQNGGYLGRFTVESCEIK